MLSANSNGSGSLYTDDKIDIEVTRTDGTKATFSKDYGNGSLIIPTTPQNVTSLFRAGNNSVKVTMTDTRLPYCNSSEYWLVESGGGGSAPAKPNIKPRSDWKGENNGVNDPQTADHIVIHHTKGTNNPGGDGTYARELQLAWKHGSLGVQTLFNPAEELTNLNRGDYKSIRSSWAGQIWLIWAEHELTNNYGDIGYHYLVDPLGNIYEGRWKGSLGENADNKGVSVENSNTGVISIAALGTYGGDGGGLANSFDGGIAEPTQSCINSIQNLTDWLSYKYNIGKSGQYQIPSNCSAPAGQCFVPNIAAHRDFSNKTLSSPTQCPGDNLNKFMAQFRGQGSQSATGTVQYQIGNGIIIGGLSPVVLGVVDPTGKRLGVDPANGQYHQNIPGGTHGKLDLFEDERESGDIPYWLHIPNPVSGIYKIDVVGTGTGAFSVAVGDVKTSASMGMRDTTTAGTKDKYQIIYSTESPSQIELYNDNIPPVTTGTMTCSRDMLGICRSEATIRLNATDTADNGTKPSGVGKIECSYDNKTTWQQCGNAQGGQFVFDKTGKYSFWYRSIDRVSNLEEAKFSGVVDVQRYLSIADMEFKSNQATTVNATGVIHSNGKMTFTNNTTLKMDILNHKGVYSQSGNVNFTYNQKAQVTNTAVIPSYPLSYYKSRCTYHNGALTINDTNPTYNKCVYAKGDITFRATTPKGKLTLVSEGKIKDESTTSTLEAWDTTNGILFYSAKDFTSTTNQSKYTGVIFTPSAIIGGSPSNTTVNGSFFGKTVNFGSGTSMTTNQAAGFPQTTYNLPL